MANEDRSTRYHRLRRRASAIAGGWRAAYLVGLVVTGGAWVVRDLTARWADGSLVWHVLLYVGVLAAGFEVVHAPLAFYREVLLERRYGLSTEASSGWWRHHARSAGLALALLLGGSLLVAALLRWDPQWWWAWTAGGFGALLLLTAHLGPALLSPRLHPVRPLADAALSARLVALAGRAGAPVVGAYEWQLGGHTKKANAALVGLGRSRRILVSDTLLERHTADEVETVLAHELGHHIHGDVWVSIALQAAQAAAGLYAADRVLSTFAGALGLAGKGDLAALPLIALVAGTVAVALRPVSNAVSRVHERRADRYALRTTGNPEAFVSVVRRMAAQNLAEERPSRLVQLLFHSHPTAASRIEAARTQTPAQG